MFFILSKALLFLLSPFNWMLLFLLLGLFKKNAVWRKRYLYFSLGLFIFFTNSAIFLEVCRLWEIPGKKINQTETYEVGIVLTGMAEYNNDLEVLSIRRGGDRIWQAITLYKLGKIKKILITGDSGHVTDRGLHEAKQMKEVLMLWGIPKQDLITEEISRNTHENALETKKILDRSYPHISRILLITSGSHMRRSLACFEKVGLHCDSFSTDLYTGRKRNYFWDQYLIPSYRVMVDWDKLIKEMVGYVVYDIAGYI